MLRMIKEKRGELRSKGNAGFTLMELIIVIAILAMLIGIMFPKFANYTDKAMGVTAGSDAKNILTLSSAYNLDNNTFMPAADIQNATNISGTALGASDGKSLTADTTTGTYAYTFKRGTAEIVATIDIANAKIDYTIKTATGNYDSKTDTTKPDPKKQVGRIARGLGLSVAAPTVAP